MIAFIELFFNTFYTKKQIRLSLWQQLWALKGVVGASFAMAFIVFITASLFDENLIKLVVETLTGIVIYAITCWVFNVKYSRQYLNILMNKAKKLSSVIIWK